MKHYVTLYIVSNGELFSIQREAPEVFAVSAGPMSMHSALIGTVSRMLAQLCAEIWRASQSTGQQPQNHNTEEAHNDERPGLAQADD